MSLYLYLPVLPFLSMRRPPYLRIFFFFNDTATTEIYTLSLHDALPISRSIEKGGPRDDDIFPALSPAWPGRRPANAFAGLTRDFYRTSSWSARRDHAALRVLTLAPAFSSTGAL